MPCLFQLKPTLQEKSAQQGIPLLKKLIETHQNDDFQIMPGGGINESNLLEILQTTKAEEFHASARMKKHSDMEFKNEKCKMGSDSSEYTIQVTSKEIVEKLVSIHHKHIGRHFVKESSQYGLLDF